MAVHGMLGVAVLVACPIAWLHARSRIRSGRPYESGAYVLVAFAVVAQVLLGIWRWIEMEGWDAGDLAVQGHAVLGVAIGVVLRFGLVRAQRERWAEHAYAIASRTFLATTALVGASWWIGQGLAP